MFDSPDPESVDRVLALFVAGDAEKRESVLAFWAAEMAARL